MEPGARGEPRALRGRIVITLNFHAGLGKTQLKGKKKIKKGEVEPKGAEFRAVRAAGSTLPWWVFGEPDEGAALLGKGFPPSQLFSRDWRLIFGRNLNILGLFISSSVPSSSQPPSAKSRRPSAKK